MTQYANLEDRIYTAGLFDGDGCISITKVKPTGAAKSEYHHLFASLENTDPKIAYWLQKRFGGSVHIDRTKEKDNHRTIYRWKLGTQETLRFLRQTISHLRIKRAQAELGIEFALKRDINRKGRSRLLGKEELERREQFYQEMRRLKHL